MHEIIKKDRVQLGARQRADLSRPGPRGRAGDTGLPVGSGRVRLVRLDGRVQGIEFTCRCGEVTVAEVEYEDQEARSESS